MLFSDPLIADPITIKLLGIEHSKSPRRAHEPNHPVRLYGHRVTDVAGRLVGVEVTCDVGVDVVTYFNVNHEFPEIEVSNKKWFYVGVIGENEALFKQEGQ